jgi:hypothetical protein
VLCAATVTDAPGTTDPALSTMFPEKLPRAWPCKPGQRTNARANAIARDNQVFAVRIAVRFRLFGKHAGLIKVECIATPLFSQLLGVWVEEIALCGNVKTGCLTVRTEPWNVNRGFRDVTSNCDGP